MPPAGCPAGRSPGSVRNMWLLKRTTTTGPACPLNSKLDCAAAPRRAPGTALATRCCGAGAAVWPLARLPLAALQHGGGHARVLLRVRRVRQHQALAVRRPAGGASRKVRSRRGAGSGRGGRRGGGRGRGRAPAEAQLEGGALGLGERLGERGDGRPVLRAPHNDAPALRLARGRVHAVALRCEVLAHRVPRHALYKTCMVCARRAAPRRCRRCVQSAPAGGGGGARAFQSRSGEARLRVPDEHRAVQAAAGELRVVRRPAHIHHRRCVRAQQVHHLPGAGREVRRWRAGRCRACVRARERGARRAARGAR